MTGSVEQPSSYSQAYEKLVQDEDDLTGLLAYALYKKAIREAASQGRLVQASAQRSPVATEIAAFRGAASIHRDHLPDCRLRRSALDRRHRSRHRRLSRPHNRIPFRP